MDANELMGYLFSPIAQIGLIIGIAEIIKRAGMPTRWIPVVDLVLGIISGLCVYGYILEYGFAGGVILGIAMGLSACGLFSGIKNVTQDREEDRNGER